MQQKIDEYKRKKPVFPFTALIILSSMFVVSGFLCAFDFISVMVHCISFISYIILVNVSIIIGAVLK